MSVRTKGIDFLFWAHAMCPYGFSVIFGFVVGTGMPVPYGVPSPFFRERAGVRVDFISVCC